MAGPPEGFAVQHVFQVTARAGSVLIFNGQCWHAGGNNQTETNRHALFGHYRKSSLIFQVDPHDEFPAEWYDYSLQDSEIYCAWKTDLGFHTQPIRICGSPSQGES
mgnify:CR=1 FL=1